VFELEGHFRPFLRDAAVLEGVGKLICLANAHQKLRLCEELFTLHTGLLAYSGERGEIYVGGEVLLAGGLIGVGTGIVTAICHERAAVAARELLVARVTVVDDHEQTAFDRARDLPNPILREDGHFDAVIIININAFTGFGMDAVAVEEFQFFGERREPSFAQAIVFESDVEFAVRAENLDRQSVKKFVGEDNQGSVGWKAAMDVRGCRASPGWAGEGTCPYVSSAGIKMLAQSFLEFRSQCGRSLLQRVSEGGKEIVEFLVRPIEHIAREQAAAGAEFEDFDFSGAIERLPYFVKLPREQASEDGVNVARGIEISGFAKLFGIGGIITVGRIVEADLHVARKRDGAALADFPLDLFAEGHGVSFPRFVRQAFGRGGRDPAGCG